MTDADTEAGRGEGLTGLDEIGRAIRRLEKYAIRYNASVTGGDEPGAPGHLWEKLKEARRDIRRLRQSDPGVEPVAWALYAVTPNGRFSQDVYFDRERIEEVNRRTNWTYESEIVPLYAAPTDEAPEGERGSDNELADELEADAKIADMRGEPLFAADLRKAADRLRTAPEGDPQRTVGCEDEDGLLIIHPESETCEVCASPVEEGERLHELGEKLTDAFHDLQNELGEDPGPPRLSDAVHVVEAVAFELTGLRSTPQGEDGDA